jgi:glycerol kinase
VVSIAQVPIDQFYPKDGWVEHDPKKILGSAKQTLEDAVEKAGLNIHDLSAIGITNQRETTIAWNRRTGEPLYPAIVWQCRRTASRCDALRSMEQEIIEKTGLVVDPYFSATKMEWLYTNVPKVRIAAENGELAFGTVDSWLAFHLTRKKSFVTDPSNASRTMLFNIHQRKWDSDMLKLFRIQESWLPEIVDTSSVIGYTPEGVPVASLAGDQQSALFGQMAIDEGMAKCTYGTGAFLLMNIGSEAILSHNRLLTSVGWTIEKQPTYIMEGSLFMCGAAVDWVVEELNLARSPSETEQMAYLVRDHGGVYFVPALSGLGAPYWDSDARGLFIGMTQSTNKNHMVRAVLESIAYGVRQLFDTMFINIPTPLKELRIDGGVSQNQFLHEFQSTLLGIPVVLPSNSETTALGAAVFAGLAVGVWNSTDDVKKHWQPASRIVRKKDDRVELGYQIWKKAVERSLHWKE